MASFVFLVLLACIAVCSASHYRYGTLSWVCKGNTATFTLESAWRRSFYSPYPNAGSTLSQIGTFTFGDKQTLNVNGIVTAADPVADWVIASTTVVHNYTSPNLNGTAYNVTFYGNARISSLKNNADKNWYLTTTVDCNLGSSPRSKMLPIANVIPINGSIATFQIPAVTDDGSQLHYTLGSSMDICGYATGCYNPLGLSVDPVTGVVTWDTTGVSIGLWCAVININTPTVRVPVDFILNYTRVAGVCAPGCSSPGKTCYLPTDCGSCSGGCIQPLPPAFIAPTPSSSVSVNAQFGQSVNFTIAASSLQPTYKVSIQTSSLPVGAVLSAPFGTNPVRLNFTWVANVTGPSIVCFSAYDDHSLQSPQYCITIEVSSGCVPDCPYNSVCTSKGECECIDGYSGANCTDFGGEVNSGDTVFGQVGMLRSNFYFFSVTSRSAIKIVADTAEAGRAVSLYLSTIPQPSIENNQWSSVAKNPNTVIVLPTDPNFQQGQYYLAVEGWYTDDFPFVSYNLTLFLS